jgi:hypothetical protein
VYLENIDWLVGGKCHEQVLYLFVLLFLPNIGGHQTAQFEQRLGQLHPTIELFFEDGVSCPQVNLLLLTQLQQAMCLAIFFLNLFGRCRRDHPQQLPTNFRLGTKFELVLHRSDAYRIFQLAQRTDFVATQVTNLNGRVGCFSTHP